MSKFIGRRFNIGIGKETVRGTGVSASYWLPRTELTFDEKIEQVKDESVMGVIESQSDATVVKKYSEGSLSGIVNDDSFGLILNALFGSCVTTGPTDSAYTHTFNFQQSAQHQSLTFVASEPNASGASSLQFALAMIDTLDLEFNVGEYPVYSLSFMANVGSSTTSSVAYTSPDNFKPQDGSVRIADVYANLASATSYAVRSVSLSTSKNTEDDHNIGSVNVTDRLNKQVQVSGSMEIVYNDREFIDTFLKADIDRALQIKLTNTDKTIGASTNPSITIKLAKVKFQEVARSLGNDEIVLQTVNFEGYYSLLDAKMLEMVLVNDVASY